MRCEIAASLLHDPQVLFLDEPTIGLDAVSKIAVREFIKTLNQEKGTTVILTTHDMQDIEALTERILLIGKGEILMDGSLSELRSRPLRGRRHHRQLRRRSIYHGFGISPAPGAHASRIAQRAGCLRGGYQTRPVSNAIAWLSSHLDVTDFSVSQPSAEELVVGLYREFGV